MHNALVVGGIVVGGSLLAYLVSFLPSIRRVENAASSQPEQILPETMLYDDHVSPFQRAVMATFVANLTGYGPNAGYFSNLRSSLIMHAEYIRLVTMIDAMRKRLRMPTPSGMSNDDCERLVMHLQNYNNFIVACAHIADFLCHAADQSYVVSAPGGDAIPEMYIPKQPVLTAYSDLYTAMWSPTSAAN